MLWENLTGKRLLIMPGHVNKLVWAKDGAHCYDLGAIRLTQHGDLHYTTEAEINLDICMYLLRLLAQHSKAIVYLGHGTWKRKLVMADFIQPDLVIEIHCNAFDDFTVRGYEAWTDADEDSVDAAAEILSSMGQGSTIPAHGKPNGHHWINKEKNPRRKLFSAIKQRPLALVECGFLTNPDDCALLVTPGYQQLVAMKIACGIEAFFAPNSGSDVAGAGGNSE